MHGGREPRPTFYNKVNINVNKENNMACNCKDYRLDLIFISIALVSQAAAIVMLAHNSESSRDKIWVAIDDIIEFTSECHPDELQEN